AGRISCTGEINGEIGNFFRLADAANRLTGDEGGTLLFIIALRAQALLQGWAFHRAGADRVAADALGNVVSRDRLGEADNGRLGDAIGETVRHALHARRDRSHVDDGAVFTFQHAGQHGADGADHRTDVAIDRES